MSAGDALPTAASRWRGAATLWSALTALGAALALTVAFFPLQVAFLVPTLAGVGALSWRFGVRRGLWYLFLVTVPLRQPLGYDVFGTTTLFLSDALLYLQFIAMLRDRGLPGIWRGSSVFRVGVVILAISALGLYSAQSLVQGVAQLQRLVGQLMVFCLARHLVRDGREAACTLLAFLAGMLPATVCGFYQTTIPVDASNFAQWAKVPLAHDAEGRSFIRVFSTFDHSLRFSHALTTAFGLALGMASDRSSPLVRPALVGLALAFAACNLFTYSLSGVLSMVLAAGVLLVITLGARSLLLAPLLLLALLVVTPNAVIYKATQMATGESTSSLARIVTYQRTFMALADHPLTGLGWGSIGETVLQDYRVAKLESIGVGAENWWLHRGLALGLPGLALYGFLAFQFGRRVTRRRRSGDRQWPRRGLLVGGMAYFAQAMLYPAAGFEAGYVLWLLFALAEVADRA
ncbi:MAG TPA: O-antigen ligase family protein, partial [bacterium]|nr:O-antigen ligase family protein [bacterium]